MTRTKECTRPMCNRRYYARGRCSMHYQRDRLSGVMEVSGGRGGRGRKHESPRAYYGDGSSLTKGGYRRIRLGPNNWILEHRHVMEQGLGRKLLRTEQVHHKNGNRVDNRIENLELWTKAQPTGQRVSDVLAWAHEMIDLYEGSAA